MMSTAFRLCLTHDQAKRLQEYLQVYRRHAFTSLIPSTTRNTMLRLLQTMQARLIHLIDQHASTLQLILSREEMAILKGIITELLLLYAHQPATTKRDLALTDLAALKAHLNSYY